MKECLTLAEAKSTAELWIMILVAAIALIGPVITACVSYRIASKNMNSAFLIASRNMRNVFKAQVSKHLLDLEREHIGAVKERQRERIRKLQSAYADWSGATYALAASLDITYKYYMDAATQRGNVPQEEHVRHSLERRQIGERFYATYLSVVILEHNDSRNAEADKVCKKWRELARIYGNLYYEQPEGFDPKTAIEQCLTAFHAWIIATGKELNTELAELDKNPQPVQQEQYDSHDSASASLKP